MTTIRFDLSEAEKLASDLVNSVSVIASAAATALNRVAATVRKDTARSVVSQVNLRENYVDGKVDVAQQATEAKPQAIVEVVDEPIFLSTYGAQQKVVSNVWTAAKYAAKFGSLDQKIRPKAGAPYLPWTPRTGDELRSIAPGAKAAGMTVAVKKGAGASLLKHSYFMPILSGKSFQGRWGAFEHVPGFGSEFQRSLYGPSVYQITKGVWRDEEGNISDLLTDDVGKTVFDAIDKELAK